MPGRIFSLPSLRRSLLYALGLIVAVCVFYLAGGALRINSMLVRQALELGKDQEAEGYLAYTPWLSIGQEPETLFFEARIARHRGDFRKMSSLLRQAERQGYPPKRIELEEGLAKAQVGQLDEVLEGQLNTWMLNEPQDLREICVAYANGLAASSRFEDAQRILEAWEGDFPDDPRPPFRQGRILEHQRQAELALTSYRRAQSRDPNFTAATFSIGRLLLEQRNVDEALQVYQSAPEAGASLPIQTAIATCLKSQGNFAEAREILVQVMTHSVEEIMESYTKLEEPAERLIPAVELGKIESDEGNFEAAEKWLKMAVDFYPRDLEARYAYAVALRGLGELDAAEKEFDQVKVTREALASVNVYWDKIQANPQDTESRLELAKILLEHESARNGVYWLKSILLYDPGNQEVLQLLKKLN
ncbi:tetratricopeptide repeat protein [Aureliella helgolandensis]|uniref:Tetratricopeptide repeat protein n=1 Tax=Aureliella helgolandensis TaxID=2527968 RepID=A0A518G8B3_9BACT|nr:tetratricopeptide repeat protein [Aureliella helgolandensis]QDV24832.1 Tetratricopeptide repeat protein [Aureliella helgolandensis]